jgi:hypothetical protein
MGTWLASVNWPIAGVTIVIMVLLLFKSEVKSLLPRLSTATLPGGSAISFGPSSEPTKSNDEKEDARRSFHLFWLGHDLGVLVSLLEAAGSLERMRLVSQQVINHLEELKLPATVVSGGMEFTQLRRDTVYNRAIMIYDRLNDTEALEVNAAARTLELARDLRLRLGEFFRDVQDPDKLR